MQSLIEQLHREYRVEIKDMARDVRVSVETFNPRTNASRKASRNVSIVVYAHGREHTFENILRVALVASESTRVEKARLPLDELLGALPETLEPAFGLWTNGIETVFRMRTYDLANGEPTYEDLADLPAPDETLDDLANTERRQLRVAGGDSLMRAFKRCHDFLYGNQSMRGDRAFWQILFLIFCKIHDEHQSRRRFSVGPTEANHDEGRKKIAARIRDLFEQVKRGEYRDVFDGTERIELNDYALASLTATLSRFNFLDTDADAKGTAYETITSTTLKRERGQFFTPRNVIKMMVEMVDPREGQRVLDPACGSGGFLVMTLNHMRRRFLSKITEYPDQPVASELRVIEEQVKTYARGCLFGVDVDPDLRKAARMNMVMNNDGHGNIFQFNSLEYGVPDPAGKKGLRTDGMAAIEKALGVGVGGAHGQFDYVFTNPPFGSKIPIENPEVLAEFELAAGQKKVPPEILFIEACYKFLKDDGVMALVLPNGILGNPGANMEAVRRWLLRRMELLASVDLPGEAFLPQVSVQASCVFLRKRSLSERQAQDTGDRKPAQRAVFMAIAENCGHGRRGEDRYTRNPDGSERRVTRTEITRRRADQPPEIRSVEKREIADDMPWIAAQYRRFLRGEPLEER